MLFQVAPILTLLIFFVIIFHAFLRSTKKESYRQTKKFLDDEEASNNVRKKPIGEDSFFVPDLTVLPIKEYTAEETEKFPVAASRQKKLIEASKNKMIRFKEPKSNRDIKFQFGTTSIETIAQYEENYSRYMYALLNWAESLIEAGNPEEARQILSASIEQGSEISKSYTLLADIYFQNKDKPKMEELYETVNKIDIPGQKKAWAHINDYLLKM